MEIIGKRSSFKIGIVLFLFLLCPSVSFGQTNENTAALQDVHLTRSSILVSDLDKSLEIYRDILGFEVAIIAESDKESYAYQVFNIPKEALIKVATLNSMDQKRIINLKEVSGITLPKANLGIKMSAVLIKVNDIKTIMEHTVKGPRISYIEQSFIDPDGHLVALYQII
ncbi:VOC family protein [Maribacter sp. 2210JD10-5]|uniref:VOC family protein n=1 Tax=Maribacter sp. 2210JD10-5 TaxID=3386272 RepID=UPI0039BD54CE